MLILTQTTDTIKVDLLEAQTTNPLRVAAMFRDITAASFAPGRQLTNTNGLTAVTVVSAPAASTQRVLDTLTVNNTDTQAKTVEVYFDENGTLFQLISVVLGIGEVLQYQDGVGWTVLTANGSVKQAQVQGQNQVTNNRQTVVLGSDVTNNNGTANTIADVTGLSFPVVSGKIYWFRFVIDYTAAAGTTGSRWSIQGPTFTRLAYRTSLALAAALGTDGESTSFNVAYDVPAGAAATSANTSGNIAIIEGFITPSAAGNVIARFSSEIASSAIVAKAGSIVEYQQLN